MSDALLPAESIVVTMARAQIERGDNPEINTTTVLLMTVDRLGAAVDAALALHQSRSAATWPGDGEELECAHCRDEWPCATARALTTDDLTEEDK